MKISKYVDFSGPKPHLKFEVCSSNRSLANSEQLNLENMPKIAIFGRRTRL